MAKHDIIFLIAFFLKAYANVFLPDTILLMILLNGLGEVAYDGCAKSFVKGMTFMIKALLVEDEPITRKGLLKHITWPKLSIDEIRSAEDAETALQMSADYHPDIIISDIKMREIDGIEMCRLFKEQLPDCQLIFISSYAQKEYLKAAIELEAIQYVEKPIDLEELTCAVKKAVERYHNIHEQRIIQKKYEKSVDHIKNETFLSLLRERNNGKDNCAVLKMVGLWNERCRVFRICIIRWADMPDKPDKVSEWYKDAAELQAEHKGIYVYTDFWDNATMIIYLAAENMQLTDNGSVLTKMSELARRQDREYMHFLAIGKLFTDLKYLSNSYQSALSALQSLSFMGYGSFASDKETCNDWQNDLDQAEESYLKKAIQNEDVKEVERIINQIFQRFIKERVILNSVIKNICLIIYNYIREAERNNPVRRYKKNASRVEYTYILEQAVTLQEIREMLLIYVQAVFGRKKIENQGSNVSVRQVIAYMSKHYQDKGLSINRMAEEVFLTPTYLSSLFKQDTGLTINQYLTKLRIECAKSLLLDTKYKLYQIADMVGYEDAAYFARIFKNQTGMTPSEYKEKNIL